MTGIRNFCDFITNNWTTICVFISIVVALYFKINHEISKWQSMDEAEKAQRVEQGKQMLGEYILGLVAKAEIEWQGSGLGVIKRSEVIQKIYDAFPTLVYEVPQEELIGLIDTLIDKALETVREKVRK